MRLHWHNFVERFLRGLESPAWQELVGTAVLSGNYEVFSTSCRGCTASGGRTSTSWSSCCRRRSPPHSFVLVGSTTRKVEAGWLSGLSEEERDLVGLGFSERHLAVRLLVDLAAISELTHPEVFASADRLIDERRATRDVARAVLAHPSWVALVAAEPELAAAATAVASDLTARGDFGLLVGAPFVRTLLDRARGTRVHSTGPSSSARSEPSSASGAPRDGGAGPAGSRAEADHHAGPGDRGP